MTPQQIIEHLQAQGIELIADNKKIRVRPKAKVTDSLKALIADNKTVLLAFLDGLCSKQNCGSQACNEKVGTDCEPGMKMSNEDLSTVVALFKVLLIIKKRSKGIGTDNSFTKKQKSNKSEVA